MVSASNAMMSSFRADAVHSWEYAIGDGHCRQPIFFPCFISQLISMTLMSRRKHASKSWRNTVCIFFFPLFFILRLRLIVSEMHWHNVDEVRHIYY
jgi:hypothetical protein